MRALIAIPGSKTLQDFGDPADVLMRKVAGVPLLVRVIATAARAGVDQVLVIWPEELNPTILSACTEWSALKGVQIDAMISRRAFDPRNSGHWEAITADLECEFLWLPWNWVTHKRTLTSIAPSQVRPVTWDFPVLLEKRAILTNAPRVRVIPGPRTDGVSITFPAIVPAAERFLVAHSGKPLDGMYSKFNRRLCRPFVRLLTHTRVTPNAITLGGLLAAILSAVLFSRGSYLNYVAGALLFFASGLFDEMDGMIARLTFRESAFGTWFEGFVDNATYLLVFSGIIAGLHREYGSFAVKYGAALIIGCALSVVAIAWQRKLATAPDRPNEYAGRMKQLLAADSSNLISRFAKHVSLFVTKAVLINYLLIFTLIGRLHMFLWLAAIGSNLTWIFALYFTRRFFRRRYTEAPAIGIRKAA